MALTIFTSFLKRNKKLNISILNKERIVCFLFWCDYFLSKFFIDFIVLFIKEWKLKRQCFVINYIISVWNFPPFYPWHRFIMWLLPQCLKVCGCQNKNVKLSKSLLVSNPCEIHFWVNIYSKYNVALWIWISYLESGL